MKKVTMWIMVVMMAFMFAQVSFAAGEPSQAAGSTFSVGAWSFGVPGPIHTALTGNEAIVVESGTVTKTEKMPGVKDSLQMKFKTNQGNSYIVYMGPKWFMDNQKLKLKAGDNIDVRGKKIGGSIIATEIGKDNMVMKLRNEEDGMPTWECCFPGKVKMQ